jgi:ubiquinone/menaquinone biosynthesis C-methylase UbiE
MYHLFGFEDKNKALGEAKRVTKSGGVILVAYCMNEYGVITYGFKERHVLECKQKGRFTPDFKTISNPSELYDYMRIEDIDKLNESQGKANNPDSWLERIKIISPDGPANYMRSFLNQLNDEEFEEFIQYQMATCERMDLIGAGAHTVDILRKVGC